MRLPEGTNDGFETIVSDIVARINRQQHIEDSRVELKSTWPNEPKKAARRIAGHANASRGGSVLWIIGIDERTGLIGCKISTTHNWWAEVSSHFDGVVPTLRDRAVSIGGVSVVVLEFGTDRAPYVVKTSETPVGREVPWREATAIRTANRAELISLFRPLRSLPGVEVLAGDLYARTVGDDDDELCLCSLQLHVVVTPLNNERVVIPRHLAKGSLWTSFGTSVPFTKIKIHPNDPNSIFVRRDQNHVAIEDGARLVVAGVAKTPTMDVLVAPSIRTEVELSVADMPKPLLLASSFVPPPKGTPAWRQNWKKRKQWHLEE